MQIDWGVWVLAIIVVVVLVAIAWWILARLYERSSTETSFVRTGFGGRKVVISGGALVVPVLHQVVRIGMNTARLTVACEKEQSLITRDRIRVDVTADFYVRVEPDAESVAAAAQTLGKRTTSPSALLDLVGAKFIDALRAVAAETTLEELHESRHVFSDRVQAMVSPGLRLNGLGIETVSIGRLDQTSREFFNPNNAFDAAGLTWLTQEIEERRRKRNEIERDAQVAIQRKNLLVEQQMLELGRDEEYARLAQEREIAIQRAKQSSDVAVEAAQRKREAEEAQILAGEAIEKTKLTSERVIREERLAIDLKVRQIDLERARALEIAEIEKRRSVELAEQQREIAVAAQASAVSVARSEAERAQADFVRAEESVISARDVERAERAGRVAVTAARAEAERAAIASVQAAEAQTRVSEHQAQASRILVEAEVAAARLRTAADETRYAIDAAGKRAVYDAENAQSPEVMALRVKLAVIERLEAIIRESGKPLERIEGIKIVQLSGLDGGGNGASLSDQVVTSALRYRTQAPMVDALLNDLGLPAGQTGGLLQVLQGAQPGNAG
jgi:uncharacterized membrane protein YqiK